MSSVSSEDGGRSSWVVVRVEWCLLELVVEVKGPLNLVRGEVDRHGLW